MSAKQIPQDKINWFPYNNLNCERSQNTLFYVRKKGNFFENWKMIENELIYKPLFESYNLKVTQKTEEKRDIPEIANGSVLSQERSLILSVSIKLSHAELLQIRKIGYCNCHLGHKIELHPAREEDHYTDWWKTYQSILDS